MDSLQIPVPALPGPSRHSGSSRPASLSPSSPPSAPPPQRKRASHSVTSPSHPEDQQQQQQQQQQQPSFRDIYSHPAAIQYAAAHPRRPIPKFGPYLLLQTLGEGEFGKVKLGLHTSWAEEVAVKLIKRHNIDSPVRMSKVEREIEVLRMLKHPNIVRLYDVIETDKYIGIILDYASGGELFDHILAHRFLKEKDACRLFAQLISGVWYIHQRKIVHRDLKLENLLLDRNRNVIITDFGFANRFEHRSDDLMQTSCGSPCYAAPELVISEGAYVGSAVDIWSCGVILYAMLAGYLPFDDDPANPDGDNINLLYKYIVNTPLSFPDYISREARDLLSIMLQPDPLRRADLSLVMRHPWLNPYAYIFEKTVEDLETSAIELHKAKRQAYQRQMRAAQTSAEQTKVSRSQSAKNDVFPHASVAVAPRSHAPEDQTLYETSADLAAASQAQAQTRRGYSSTIVMPTQPSGYVDDDPFAQNSANLAPVSIPIASTSAEQPQPHRAHTTSHKDQLPPIPTQVPAVNGTGSVRSKAASGMRHTIQVEYGQPEPSPVPPQPKREMTPKKEHKRSQDLPSSPPLPQPSPPQPQLLPLSPSQQQQQQREKPRRSSLTGPRPPPSTSSAALPSIPTPAPPKIQPPLVTINAASPPATPQSEEKGPYTVAGVSGSGSSKRGKHSRGISIDKMGLGKLFGTPSPSEAAPPQAARAPSESSAANSLYTTISKISGSTSRRPSTLQVAPSTSSSPTVEASSTQTSLLTPDSGKKSRRSTLSVMVEPLARTIKVRPGRSLARDSETPVRGKEPSRERQSRSAHPTSTSEREAALGEKVQRAPDTVGYGMPASTSKARKVMQWFRSRSKGRGPGDDGDTSVSLGGKPSVRNAFAVGANDSSTSINAAHPFPTSGVVEEYTQVPSLMGPPHPQRAVSTGAEGAPTAPSFAELVRRHVAPPRGVIRTHHGAVSQATVTTGPPIEVMRHVREVLEGMGVDVQDESEYKYRCVRAKRRRAPTAPSGFGLGLRDPGLAAFTLIGSAASNGVDKRGLPVPSQSTFGGATGGMLKGLLMRRQSSQVSGETEAPSPDMVGSPVLPGGGRVLSPGELAPAMYGDPNQDQGDEVRFYVELTKLDGLKDTYSIDIRRLKGNLRSYKFLYDCITERLVLQR